MSPDHGERVGLAIVRCWCESDSPSGLRAHVTILDDITEPPTVVAYAATIDEVVDQVTRLLTGMQIHESQGRG